MILRFEPPYNININTSEKLEQLLDHYDGIVDKDATRQEWVVVKELVLQQQYPRDKLSTHYGA